MTQRLSAVLLTLALLATYPARGEDWPEFRGPTGQGLALQAKPPVEWSPKSNVAWKQALPGSGWSSPVVVSNRIYLTSSVSVNNSKAKDLNLEALCLDAKTGKLLWEKEIFHEPASAPRIHGKNSHASPTPLVYDGKVYVHFGHQGTACLDTDGKILWKNTTLSYPPVHGNGGSPILVDGKLIFSCDGGSKPFVVALDSSSGKVLWKVDRANKSTKPFSFSTPLLITVKDQKQVISPGSDAVYAYDPENGKEIWHVRYDGYSLIPRPVFGHGLVFVCTGYNTPTLLAIRPDGSGDVTDSHVAWSAKKGVPHTASLLLQGDELYMVSDSGTASCLDAKSGTVNWQERLGGGYSASPVYADGKIYFQSEDGAGTVVKSGQKYQQLARNPLGERTLASYAVVDGALFIRTDKNLYRFEAK